jgi:hypothetical protein
VDEKLGRNAGAQASRSNAATDALIDGYVRKVSRVGYYPFPRPTHVTEFDEDQVKEWVRQYKHTTESSLPADKFGPLEDDADLWDSDSQHDSPQDSPRDSPHDSPRE